MPQAKRLLGKAKSSGRSVRSELFIMFMSGLGKSLFHKLQDFPPGVLARIGVVFGCAAIELHPSGGNIGETDHMPCIFVAQMHDFVGKAFFL